MRVGQVLNCGHGLLDFSVHSLLIQQNLWIDPTPMWDLQWLANFGQALWTRALNNTPAPSCFIQYLIIRNVLTCFLFLCDVNRQAYDYRPRSKDKKLKKIGFVIHVLLLTFFFSLNHELPCTTQANLCGEEGNNIQRNTILQGGGIQPSLFCYLLSIIHNVLPFINIKQKFILFHGNSILSLEEHIREEMFILGPVTSPTWGSHIHVKGL